MKTKESICKGCGRELAGCSQVEKEMGVCYECIDEGFGAEVDYTFCLDCGAVLSDLWGSRYCAECQDIMMIERFKKEGKR
jgi:hypothetical protein